MIAMSYNHFSMYAGSFNIFEQCASQETLCKTQVTLNAVKYFNLLLAQ